MCFNNDKDTISALESLRKSHYRSMEVFLVDNSSRTYAYFDKDKLYALADCVVTAKNKGFAAASNIGIKYALAKNFSYVWLVNNDLFVEPQTLNNLLDAIRSYPKASCSCPKILFSDDPTKIQFAGGFKPNEPSHWSPRGSWETDKESYNYIQEVDWVSGGCMLMGVQAIKDIGLLDERFFIYYEDVDWCLRAKKRGWACLYVGTTKVSHKTGRSVKEAVKYYYPRAQFLFLAKYYPYLLFTALKKYNSHFLLAHLKQKDWAGVLMDVKVYLGFFFKWFWAGLISPLHH